MNRRACHVAIAIAVTSAGAAAGCSWDLERMNEQPRCESQEATPWFTDGNCDRRAPAGTVSWGSAIGTDTEPAPTRTLIERGRDRFERFCAPCHGSLGDARSVVARDMILRPPASLHEPRLREVTDRQLFDVITEGYGMMPPYRAMVAPADRWAIVHYVRVLQRSQATSISELTPELAREGERWLR
ncbi:MAG: cytochrome c [Kofleriaceae bacterium]